MDAKALKEVTSELSVLYVEDDENLREETSRLLGHLFKKIETAENGQLALDKMKESDFDLVITDINMPIMNGITFTKHIREKDLHQPIIVTSAHDESPYLIELIELGIDKFILKPLDLSRLVATLTQVCSNIANKKLLHKYKQEIERSNMQLKDSNQELEVLVRVLDAKIEQLNKLNRSQYKDEAGKNMSSRKPSFLLQDPSNINAEGLYLYQKYLQSDDLKKLKVLESGIAAQILLVKLQKTVETASILPLADLFQNYAQVLHNYPVFNIMTNGISSLAQSLKGDASVFIKTSCDILILLESFFYVLKKWRLSLFETGIKNPHMYDMSMLNDIHTITIILRKDAYLEHNNDFF